MTVTTQPAQEVAGDRAAAVPRSHRRKAGHLTVAEREKAGRAARSTVPRRSHGVWEPPTGRSDPISQLEEQAASRVEELVPIRHGRMAANPFAFYRGAAAIMASDLASTPQSGFRAQLCGDAHLANFGGFASAERELIFDVNDFDETFPGPWEWDVKRLVASMAVAGRERGFAAAERRAIIMAAVRRYRDVMRALALEPNLAVW